MPEVKKAGLYSGKGLLSEYLLAAPKIKSEGWQWSDDLSQIDESWKIYGVEMMDTSENINLCLPSALPAVNVIWPWMSAPVSGFPFIFTRQNIPPRFES